MAAKPTAYRFLELAEKFLELEPQIPEGPEKQAISLLHAMIQEGSCRSAAAPASNGELTLAVDRDADDLAPSRSHRGIHEPPDSQRRR